MAARGWIDFDGRTDWRAVAARTAHVAVGISSLRSGAFIEANDAFCRLLQRSRDGIVGRTAAELDLWPDRQQRDRLIELIRLHGAVNRYEAQYRNSLGEIGVLEISARIVEQDGEPVLIGFLTEVSDQREFVDGLRVAQARLDLVLRSSGTLVFRQDSALRYTWVANPALGAQESELIGRTDEEIIGADAAAPLVAIKRRVLESGQAERQDVWVVNKDQMGCFDLIVEPERDLTGRVVGIVCAAQDITQRVTAQRGALAGPGHAIRGMAALIGRESLSPRQGERLGRIDRVATALARPAHAIPALQWLQMRHVGALVLLAEQHPVLREMLQALLEQSGLRVVTASTGVEAFSFTLQVKPALVLLDMELPQGGGVAAARAIRTMAPPGLPIVAMLSRMPLMGAGPALDADVDDVLDKPVTAPALFEKLLAWLESR